MTNFKKGDIVTPIKFDDRWVREFYQRGKPYRVKNCSYTTMRVYTINSIGETTSLIVPKGHFKLYKKSVII